MNKKNMFKKLEKIISKDEMNQLAQSLIITTDDGYELFSEYSISSNKDMFVVSKHTSYLVKEFHSLRNAVVWATLDKRNKISDAARVSELDILLEGAVARIDLHTILCERAASLDAKSTHVTKLREAMLKRDAVQAEITSYINEAKRWQNGKFKQAAK